jgi:hypothetical protein
MKMPEWLELVLSTYAAKTSPFMEVELGEAINKGFLESASPSDDDRRATLAEHSAFMFMERLDEDSPWGTYFAPMMEGTKQDGTQVRMPDISILDAESVEHWAQRSRATTNPLMCARYADCVWDLENSISGQKRRHEFARLASSSYIDAVEARLYFSEINGVEWLARALALAKSVRDDALLGRAAAATLTFRDATLNPAHIGVWIAPFDFLYGEKFLSPEQEAKIVADLETMLASVSSTVSGHFDPFGAQAAAERLSKHYKTAEEKQRLAKVFGSAFEELSRNAAPMLAMAWLQPVIERYEQLGMKDEAERLSLFASQKGANIADDMKTYTVEAPFDKSQFDALVGQLLEGDLEAMLHQVARLFLPDVNGAKAALENLRVTAPLQALIQVVISRPDGQPAARIGSVDEDAEGRLQKQIADNVMFLQPFLTHTLKEVLNKANPTATEVTNVLYGSPLFTDRRRILITEGISAYLVGDYIKTIHVLVPQVEDTLRTLLGKLGVPIYKSIKEQPGVVDVKSMGDVLRDARIQAALSENCWRYLAVLYTDRRGINLRNNVAHGLVSPEALNQATADLVIHSLLSLSLLRISGKDS